MNNKNQYREQQEYNPMILGSYVDSIDDVREQYGEDYAGAFALRILYYGVRRIKFNDLNSICNATLESIYPKLEKSSENASRTKKRESIKGVCSKAQKDDSVARKENGKGDDKK